ncbi:hypothetical protein [Hymenobacter gelipurpurascens]|nr:hypothetical protein [Hymenobacter gelipurpurascens]
MKQLSDATCQRLTMQQQRVEFASLSSVQAQQTFEQALSDVIEEQVPAIRQLAQRSQVAGAYEKLRTTLPTTVAIQLVRTCRPAASLYQKFSRTNTDASDAEKAFISSWGDELCQRLTALNTQGSLQKKTSAERTAVFRKEFMSSLNSRGPQIMQLYGPAGNNQQTVQYLGNLLSGYMLTSCSQMKLLLGSPD